MQEVVETTQIGEDEVTLVLSDHVQNYLQDPHSPNKTLDRRLLINKMREALPEIYAIFRRQRAAMTGAIMSASTRANIVFAFRRLRLRQYKLLAVTIEVKTDFAPKKRSDYLIKVSKKTKRFKGQAAYEIGPNIYALPTSFECADAYGLIIPHLVREISAMRKEFAPGFYGSFETRDQAVYCVAQVDDLGTFFVDSAFWQPYGDFETVKVR